MCGAGSAAIADAAAPPALLVSSPLLSAGLAQTSNNCLLYTSSTWSCWENGCSTQFKDTAGHNVTYLTAGMQQLVDAVRSSGARNPLCLLYTSMCIRDRARTAREQLTCLLGVQQFAAEQRRNCVVHGEPDLRAILL